VEVKENTPAWLSKTHPNYLRWERARDLSIERGRFVYSIVGQKVSPVSLTVLDLGSGEGGTSEIFSKNNFVISLDLSLIRLRRQYNSYFIFPKINASALQLPFVDNSFNLILIQDVIEHLTEVPDFYSEIKRILKNDGLIYLSTPNKLSAFNFLSDPHFGLLFASILKRKSIKKYFLKYFRKDDYKRSDIAELFSLNSIINLFQNDFQISLFTKFSVQELFKGNIGIVWSSFHIKLIAFCQFFSLDRLLIKIANDKIGIINKYFTPTFYLVLKKL